MELKIGLEKNANGDANAERRVIQILGSLDLYNAQGATQTVRPFLDESGVRLVVDLAGLEFIDSSGIGMLYHWKHQVERNGGRFQLRHLPDALHKTLDLGRLNEPGPDA